MSAVQRVRDLARHAGKIALRESGKPGNGEMREARADSRALDLAADVCEAGIQWRDLIRTGAMLDEVETGLLAALDRLAAGEEVTG